MAAQEKGGVTGRVFVGKCGDQSKRPEGRILALNRALGCGPRRLGGGEPKFRIKRAGLDIGLTVRVDTSTGSQLSPEAARKSRNNENLLIAALNLQGRNV